MAVLTTAAIGGRPGVGTRLEQFFREMNGPMTTRELESAKILEGKTLAVNGEQLAPDLTTASRARVFKSAG